MKRLKLNELEATRLSERQLSSVKGGKQVEMVAEAGYNCSCGCQGPSSSKDNKNANIEGGLQTPG